jgi:hypothetical protein
MIDNDLESLGQLLGAYFHQDWLDEFENEHAAIDAIVQGEPAEQVAEAVQEIDKLLAGALPESELRKVMVDCVGCYFDPSSNREGYADWLKHLRQIFAQASTVG